MTPAALEGLLRDIVANDFWMALYAELPKEAWVAYTGRGEVAGQGYMAGGQKLTGNRVTVDRDTAILTFDTPVWNNSTLNVGGAIIYDRSRNNRTMVAIPFATRIVSRNGIFRGTMPPPTREEGIIRLIPA